MLIYIMAVSKTVTDIYMLVPVPVWLYYDTNRRTVIPFILYTPIILSDFVRCYALIQYLDTLLIQMPS